MRARVNPENGFGDCPSLISLLPSTAYARLVLNHRLSGKHSPENSPHSP